MERIAANEAGIARAAELLRAGRLVAFPTETVYGLGARADDADAVRAIYRAKGRPAENPTIVHAGDAEAAFALARDVPPAARALAARAWPGPLTIVLPVRAGCVAPEVTAFGSTVGLRVPAHPVAQALLAAAGVPVAAPSANRSNRLSPTTAEHVVKSFGADADLCVLDGGATTVGLESTIVDLSGPEPAVLRRGMLLASELRALLGPGADAVIDRGEEVQPEGERLAAPGRSALHYAPRVPLLLVDRAALVAAPSLVDVAVVCLAPAPPLAAKRVIALPAEPGAYARRFYGALHELEDAGARAIWLERPPTGEGWAALHDRLRRAAIASP